MTDHQHQYDESNVCEICGAKPPDFRRWTIWNTTVEFFVEGPKAGEWTGDGQGVVPCDDAAIRRAVRAASDEQRQQRGDATLQELIEIAFRAAGETP